jgi:hypothetical protein
LCCTNLQIVLEMQNIYFKSKQNFGESLIESG